MWSWVVCSGSQKAEWHTWWHKEARAIGGEHTTRGFRTISVRKTATAGVGQTAGGVAPNIVGRSAGGVQHHRKWGCKKGGDFHDAAPAADSAALRGVSWAPTTLQPQRAAPPDGVLVDHWKDFLASLLKYQPKRLPSHPACPGTTCTRQGQAPREAQAALVRTLCQTVRLIPRAPETITDLTDTTIGQLQCTKFTVTCTPFACISQNVT